MDQGIIQTLKLKYRKRQLRHMAVEIEKNPTKTDSEILKRISALDAVYWINATRTDAERVVPSKNVLRKLDLLIMFFLKVTPVLVAQQLLLIVILMMMIFLWQS